MFIDTAPATVTRSLKLDLFPPAELRQRVLGSVREYRAALRHCFAVLAQAQAAGAEITWRDDDCRVTARTDAARVICGLGTGQATVERSPRAGDHKRGDGSRYTVRLGNGAVYELRAELKRQLPTALTFVLDSARRDIAAAWQARDPEFPAASRGWLTLQGVRGPALFRHRGIGLPAATAKPRLEKRSLVLRWDRGIGEVEFGVGKLDGGRWRVWEAVRGGGWGLGTVYLSERDRKPFAVLSHSRPADTRDVDPARVLEVTVLGDDPDALIRYHGPDGVETADTIPAADVRAFLDYQSRKRTDLESRRGANGSPRRPWGFRKGWLAAQTTLAAATVQRERGVADRNHAWARRLADRAAQWRCGVVRVGPLPETIHGHPWNWTGLRAAVEYKCGEVGVTVVWSE